MLHIACIYAGGLAGESATGHLTRAGVTRQAEEVSGCCGDSHWLFDLWRRETKHHTSLISQKVEDGKKDIQ